MRSPLRKLAAAAVAALACVAGAAHAENYTPAARQVLAQARRASGGDGWNSLRGWHEVGVQGAVRYERWIDPLRYGVRTETHEPGGLHVHAFNGAADWQIMPSGQITGVDDVATVTEARTTAFFSAHGFLFPSRYAARGDSIGVRQAQGRAFDVLRIQPLGGKPRELWFDSRTHLLARVVDRGRQKPVTIELSDYRRVGPVMAAFRYVIDDGDPAHRQEIRVEKLDLPAIDRKLFSLPPPPRPAPVVAAPEPPAAAPVKEHRSRIGRWLNR